MATFLLGEVICHSVAGFLRDSKRAPKILFYGFLTSALGSRGEVKEKQSTMFKATGELIKDSADVNGVADGLVAEWRA
jgi:hypothetical protein